jgi:hypothetical protein
VRLLLVLLALCACRGPDTIAIIPHMGFGKLDGRRFNDYENETYGVAFFVGWSVGDKAKAYSNLAKLDVSKSGELLARTHAFASPVTIHAPDHPPPASAGTEGLDKILLGVGAVLASVAAVIWKMKSNGSGASS